MSQCSKEIISVSQRHRITWGLTYNRSYTFVDFWEFNTYSAKCCGYRSIRVAIQTFGCQLLGITNSADIPFLVPWSTQFFTVIVGPKKSSSPTPSCSALNLEICTLVDELVLPSPRVCGLVMAQFVPLLQLLVFACDWILCGEMSV